MGLDGSMSVSGYRKIVLLCGLCGVVFISYCSISWRSRGLFNNLSDQEAALSEHNQAWRQMGRGGAISRLDLLMMMRRFDGECITSEANWIAVPLDQRLDVGLGTRGTPIECRVKVRARWPKGLAFVFVWRLTFTVTSEEQLRIVKTERVVLQ